MFFKSPSQKLLLCSGVREKSDKYNEFMMFAATMKKMQGFIYDARVGSFFNWATNIKNTTAIWAVFCDFCF